MELLLSADIRFDVFNHFRENAQKKHISEQLTSQKTYFLKIH